APTRGQKAQEAGIVSIRTDMCINGCHAYTGPLAERTTCLLCKTARYKDNTSPPEKRQPQQYFTNIPIGPYLQAMRRSPEIAEQYKYLGDCVKDIRNKI
ncbi:hypothetical protein BDV98DRAFT_480273, partial [Pterulicium gracile]